MSPRPRRVRLPLRDLALLVDTGLSSIANAAVLLLSARLMSLDEAGEFSLALLVATAVLAVQRAAVVNPTLAAQRVGGRSYLPLAWIMSSCAPLGLVGGVGIAATAPADGPASAAIWGTSGCLLSFGLLTQDYLRRRAFTLGRGQLAVYSSAATLVGSMLGLAIVAGAHDPSPPTLMLVVALAALVSALPLVSVRASAEGSELVRARFGDSLPYAKWAVVDSILSQAAMLIPMVVAVGVIGPDIAARYRVVQVATGPLNMVATTVVTSIGLDAWQVTTRAALSALSAKIVRLSVVLGVGSIGFMAVAVAASVAISGIDLASSILPISVVVLSSVLLAFTAPSQAGALVLGMQWVGVAIRVVVFVGSVLVSVAAGGDSAAPAMDPIAMTSLLAATATLVGWVVSYWAANSREAGKLPV